MPTINLLAPRTRTILVWGYIYGWGKVWRYLYPFNDEG